MLNILIVDDDSLKIADVCNLLDAFPEIPKENIDCELDIKRAFQKLQAVHYDLVILDIRLPNHIGSPVINEGGISLLEAIYNTERIKKPSHIIGLSSYDDLVEDHNETFLFYNWALLKYNQQTCEWKDKIRNRIKYIIEWKRQMLNENQRGNNFDCDFAVITAVDVEYKSFLELKIDWENISFKNDGTQYKKGIIKKGDKAYSVVLAKQHQMGMTAAATLSMKMIYNFNPKCICMIGIAAGKKGRVALGDIIIAAETWDYGSGKIKENTMKMGEYSFEPEPHQIAIDSRLKELFDTDFCSALSDIRQNWNRTAGNKIAQDIKIHVGPLASGAAVMQDEQTVNRYIDPYNRKLLGLDMETYAVYYAAQNCIEPRPKFFSIKSVCDFADAEKNDSFQSYAAYVSACFFFYLVSNVAIIDN